MAISAYFVMVSLRLFSVHNSILSGALTIVIFLYAFMCYPFNLNYSFLILFFFKYYVIECAVCVLLFFICTFCCK